MRVLEIAEGRKKGANAIVAHLPGVRVELAKAATQIGMVASGILRQHHGQSDAKWERKHNLPAPYIDVSQGKKLDWFVALVAEGYANRAIGIEYGHRFEGVDKNATGPWGESGGLNALGRATDIVAYMRYAGVVR